MLSPEATQEQRHRGLGRREPGRAFLLGDEAIALGALYAGCTFYAGYPITPASEIAEAMSRELPLVGGRYVQMEDEIASMAAVVGAAWAGARAMTATSGPGFSLMQENLGHAIMTETPCVLVDVQRSGPSTGQATKPAQGDIMQARWGTHGDHEIVALSPASVQECFDLTIEAFRISERLRTPVILLADGEIGHVREVVQLPDPSSVTMPTRRIAEAGEAGFGGGEMVPPMPEIGHGLNTHITGSTHKPNGLRDVTTQAVHDALVRRLVTKITEEREALTRVEAQWIEDAEVIVVCTGAPARPALGAVAALRAQGHAVGFLRLLGIWPFPIEALRQACAKARVVFVPELSLGQLNREIERHVELPVRHYGRIGGILPTVAEIKAEIEALLEEPRS
jgi:2-oxoglutarate/2-oxoacid ferredoxin oxidoreductase subunit alpha